MLLNWGERFIVHGNNLYFVESTYVVCCRFCFGDNEAIFLGDVAAVGMRDPGCQWAFGPRADRVESSR